MFPFAYTISYLNDEDFMDGMTARYHTSVKTRDEADECVAGLFNSGKADRVFIVNRETGCLEIRSKDVKGGLI